MKAKLTKLAVLAAVAAVLGASAATETVGGYTWTYRIVGDAVEIAAVSPEPTGDVVIPPTLGDFTVAGIRGWAFEDCTKLTGVTLPNSVTTIGEGVFSGCSRLRSVSISTNVTSIGAKAFADCKVLASIVIPSSVTNVGEYAFVGCSELKSVTFPQCICDSGLWYVFDADLIKKVVIADGATSIGESAFEGCYNLANVTIPSSVTNIGDYAFAECYSLKRVSIPSSVESIGEGAFADCWELASATIPAGVTTINDNVFNGCFSLSRVTIPEGVVSIGASAFADCCDLAGVSIPNSVTNIGEQAFVGCTSMSSLTIPDSVTVIGEGAFYECSGLASVTIPITYFADHGMRFAFDTTLFGDVVISERVYDYYYYHETRIPDDAFANFINITSVKLPDHVTEIGDRAFYGCTSLRSVNLPDAVWDANWIAVSRGVWRIGSNAFAWCRNLTTIAIPYSASQIEFGAFRNCYALKNVKIPLDAVRSYGQDYIFGFEEPDVKPSWETLEITGSYDYRYEIPDHAFEGLLNLRSVTLPASIRSIGDSAFCNCPKLESVTIAEGARPQNNNNDDWEIGSQAFRDCASLKRVDVPEGVKCIRSEAFYGCTSLADVTLPDSVTSIESMAFYNCRSLKDINFPEGVWEYTMLNGGVRSIGALAFYGCSSLAAADIPACLVSIGFKAFGMCSGLKEVTLPSLVFEFYYDNSSGTHYYEYGYTSYSGLDAVFDEYFETPYGNGAYRAWETVTVVNPVWDWMQGVSAIPYNAFAGLQSLRSVVLPASVRSIGSYAFENCPKLESVTIAEGARPQNYNNEYWEIGSSAFWNCSSLKRVDIPDGVKYIRSEAFYGCVSLASVTLPDSVTSIGSMAFYGCRGLMNVTIPSGVAEIEVRALAECSSLRSIKFMGNAPETVYDSSFENVAENCTAYVLPDSTGWGVNAGETWKGLRLMYWYYAGFPLVENDADVVVAMAGSADGRLASMITNVVEYYAYWDWAHSVKNRIGQPVETSEVKASPHAAAAYLLGAEELFDNEPTIVITGVSMGDGEGIVATQTRGGATLYGQARSASMTVSVVVKDGERAVAVDAAKVAAMFEATSDLGDWAGAAKLTPSVEVLEGDGSTMRFRVTPGDGTAPSAFLRIRRWW